MAIPYAANTDLQALIPSILDNGIATFVPQLTSASNDILELIKLDWWVNAVTTRYGFARETVDINPLFPTFDATKINEAVLVNITCYRALAQYICPMLTTDSDEADEWSRKMDRYNLFYEAEWDRLELQALYDFNGDAQFSDIERRASRGRRLSRA